MCVNSHAKKGMFMRLVPVSAAIAATLIVGLTARPLSAQAGSPAPAARQDSAGDPAAALASTAVEAGEGRVVATKLADDLVQNFVFREQAEAYAAMLRKNAAAGRYDDGTRGEVAKLMTDDLQAVHKDGHLKVMLANGGQQPGAERGGPPRNLPPLIQAAKTIAPGIGYIRFTAFFGRDDEMAAVRKWLVANKDAKTLIFDLRNHHGGGLDEQDAIFSYVYAEKTPLVKMAIADDLYKRRGFPVEERASFVVAATDGKMVGTHYALPGETTALRNAKIYLLTSNRSASAAEHFALALKSTGRATLIGESTAGANHFGGPQQLNANFAVWMPVGRTYDIRTGKDWEGAGIAPDIAVDPKDALVVALEKAGVSHAEAVKLDAGEVPAEPIHSDKLQAR